MHPEMALNVTQLAYDDNSRWNYLSSYGDKVGTALLEAEPENGHIKAEEVVEILNGGEPHPLEHLQETSVNQTMWAMHNIDAIDKKGLRLYDISDFDTDAYMEMQHGLDIARYDKEK